MLPHFGKFSKGIDKVRKVMYNIKAVKFTAFIWTGIEEVITALTRKVIHPRELRPTESLDFTWVLRFCISQKLACFALNFALISSFVKIVGLTYKNLIYGQVSKRS